MLECKNVFVCLSLSLLGCDDAPTELTIYGLTLLVGGLCYFVTLWHKSLVGVLHQSTIR